MDCLEYCQKTVDQVMYERARKEEKEEEKEEEGLNGGGGRAAGAQVPATASADVTRGSPRRGLRAVHRAARRPDGRHRTPRERYQGERRFGRIPGLARPTGRRGKAIHRRRYVRLGGESPQSSRSGGGAGCRVLCDFGFDESFHSLRVSPAAVPHGGSDRPDPRAQGRTHRLQG